MAPEHGELTLTCCGLNRAPPLLSVKLKFLMRTTLDPCWVTVTFLWVSPTVTFQPDPCPYPLPLKTLQTYFTMWICTHGAAAPPTQHALLLVSFQAVPRLPPCSSAPRLEPNYKSAIGCWWSNSEGRSLTCMASIVSLTTMSGFTLAVNCPPPPLGSLAPSCRILSCFFLPFLSPRWLEAIWIGWQLAEISQPHAAWHP